MATLFSEFYGLVEREGSVVMHVLFNGLSIGVVWGYFGIISFVSTFPYGVSFRE